MHLNHEVDDAEAPRRRPQGLNYDYQSVQVFCPRTSALRSDVCGSHLPQS